MNIIQLLFFFLIIIPSAIIHEYAHAWAADQLGDPTARNSGRLTLNPLAHVDMWGTILMPLLLFVVTGGGFMFAYAKPVPYNPYNLRNQKRDPGLVGLAGPASNLLVALIFGLIVRFSPVTTFTSLLAIIVYANILLAVFNLVPIPPLDGSKVLFSILPDSAYAFRENLERYGFILLLFFIFFLFQWITPIIQLVFHLIVGRYIVF